ncbi:9030_t:CDS:2, partial [Gigaspora margarita]
SIRPQHINTCKDILTRRHGTTSSKPQKNDQTLSKQRQDQTQQDPFEEIYISEALNKTQATSSTNDDPEQQNNKIGATGKRPSPNRKNLLKLSQAQELVKQDKNQLK